MCLKTVESDISGDLRLAADFTQVATALAVQVASISPGAATQLEPPAESAPGRSRSLHTSTHTQKQGLVTYPAILPLAHTQKQLELEG